MNSTDSFKDPNWVKALRERVPREHSVNALSHALYSALKKESANARECAVLFSGGLDSSVIAFLLRLFVPRLRLYCAGLKESYSLERARANAELLGLELREVVIEKESLPLLLEEAGGVIDSREALQLEIAVPELAALKAVKEDSVKLVFSGTGADELFCGYAEFASALREKGYSGVEALCWEKLETMFERNLKRELALAERFSLSAAMPFLEEQFVLQAMAFPAREKIFSPADQLRKHPLRELARSIGLAEVMCSERKKAIQYDSGVSREIRKIIKQSSVGKPSTAFQER